MTFFPYPTVSSFFEVEGDFEENLHASDEDLAGFADWMDPSYDDDDDEARMEWENQSYAEWAAEHAEDLAEAAYTEWAHMRDEDGMDSSREAYEAHIDALVAASEPD